MRSNHRMSNRIVGCLAAGLLMVSAVSYSQDGQSGKEILKKIADIPIPGPAVRFDYQSLDVENGRLYISHMNADQLVVFDTAKREVVANLDGFKRVHGVFAVPEINRLYASVTSDHQVAVVNTKPSRLWERQAPSTIRMAWHMHPHVYAFSITNSRLLLREVSALKICTRNRSQSREYIRFGTDLYPPRELI
jgi:hypothetical protein